jgi:hypothetical protein
MDDNLFWVLISSSMFMFGIIGYAIGGAVEYGKHWKTCLCQQCKKARAAHREAGKEPIADPEAR